MPGQIIVTSHSAAIATQLAATTATPFAALRILRHTPVVTQVTGDQTDLELRKALRVLVYNQGEVFFATAAIVVEGITERASLPVFADRYFGEKDALQRRAVSIVETGSKDTHPRVLRTLRELGIPAIGLIDEDGQPRVGQYDHAVSRPDWEGALVAHPSRMTIVLAFVGQQEVDRCIDDQIRSGRACTVRARFEGRKKGGGAARRIQGCFSRAKARNNAPQEVQGRDGRRSDRNALRQVD